MTLRLVVMGVSGCGKSTLGAALAHALRAEFVDADTLHPPCNIAKMQAGTPLTDADRWPWLDRVAQVLSQKAPVVVACSALKRAYRDRLRREATRVVFVHAQGDPALVAQRLAQRSGHFMPAGLLESQLATLEPPTPDEAALTPALDAPLEWQIADVLDRLTTMTSRTE